MNLLNWFLWSESNSGLVYLCQSVSLVSSSHPHPFLYRMCDRGCGSMLQIILQFKRFPFPVSSLSSHFPAMSHSWMTSSLQALSHRHSYPVINSSLLNNIGERVDPNVLLLRARKDWLGLGKDRVTAPWSSTFRNTNIPNKKMPHVFTFSHILCLLNP